MKLLVIPDIHGSKNWLRQCLEAIDQKAHIVFLGDYVDSYTEQDAYEIYLNFIEIIEFKKKYPEDVTLLLGNHDFAYVFGKTYTSGFLSYMWHDYSDLINRNWRHFDLAWGFQGKDKYTLLTHAGLTQHFYNNIINEILDPESVMNAILVQETDVDWKTLPLHELLNYFKDEEDLLWQVGKKRKGRDITGSVVWADKDELTSDPFKGIDQMVGHTNSEYFEIKFIEDDKIFFLDIRSWDSVIGFMTELE